VQPLKDSLKVRRHDAAFRIVELLIIVELGLDVGGPMLSSRYICVAAVCSPEAAFLPSRVIIFLRCTCVTVVHLVVFRCLGVHI
jgi:hypothetical protein